MTHLQRCLCLGLLFQKRTLSRHRRLHCEASVSSRPPRLLVSHRTSWAGGEGSPALRTELVSWPCSPRSPGSTEASARSTLGYCAPHEREGGNDNGHRGVTVTAAEQRCRDSGSHASSPGTAGNDGERSSTEETAPRSGLRNRMTLLPPEAKAISLPLQLRLWPRE